ncbi:MAG: hypothetical protein IJ379_11340 [Lachnospiraceae bacterium]|nr:hypothetical protein [Lachnospiraceae bacterium]
MVAFLLGLLKVIGIVLLILLILVLVIVGVVLFVPIHYQADGQISEEKKEASARVTWLLRAVRVGVDYVYPQSPVISVKILWVDVLKLLEKRKAKAAKKEQAKLEKEKAKLEKEKQKHQPEAKHPLLEMWEEEQREVQMSEAQQKQEEPAPESIEADLGETDTDTSEGLEEKIENIIFKITSVYDKIKNIIANIQYYIAVLQEEDTKALLAYAWDAIVKILKSIRPKVFELQGEFGFDTPDTTGKVYGGYCAVSPLLGEHVQLTPNFEEQILRGRLHLKGKITIFVIVVNVLRVLFDKRLKPLINKLKNGGNQNGGE